MMHSKKKVCNNVHFSFVLCHIWNEYLYSYLVYDVWIFLTNGSTLVHGIPLFKKTKTKQKQKHTGWFIVHYASVTLKIHAHSAHFTDSYYI